MIKIWRERLPLTGDGTITTDKIEQFACIYARELKKLIRDAQIWISIFTAYAPHHVVIDRNGRLVNDDRYNEIHTKAWQNAKSKFYMLSS